MNMRDSETLVGKSPGGYPEIFDLGLVWEIYMDCIIHFFFFMQGYIRYRRILITFQLLCSEKILTCSRLICLISLGKAIDAKR